MSTIDPGMLPNTAVVEVVAEYFDAGRTHLTTALDAYQRGDLTITRVFVPVPDGMTVQDAAKALDAAHPDRAITYAIEDAVPDGEWTGKAVLANLRAAGFDVVRVCA